MRKKGGTANRGEKKTRASFIMDACLDACRQTLPILHSSDSCLVPPLQLAPKQPPFGVGTLFCQSQLTAQYLFIMYCKWLGGEARRETHSAWTVLPSTKNWPIIVAQLAYYLNNTDTAPTIHLLPKSKLTTAL